MVLAGGIGSRFWPLSTRARPKQLLPLASTAPLISDTVARARALVPDERIRIVAGDHLAEPFRSVLPDLPADAYLVEPEARGTGPALAWAAWELVRRDPDAVMVSLHADHLVRPLDAFVSTVGAAIELASERDLLVCIGAEPDRVETGYGHIEPGAELAVDSGVGSHLVRAFHEKPDAETAAAYVRAGHLWNTGMFVWKAATFLDEVRRCAPDLAGHLPKLEEGPDAFFSAVPPSVVDRAVMERSDRIATVRATFTWDDVGSWEALSRTRTTDDAGNVLVGDARVVEGSGNIAFADGGAVVLFGVDDLVVVRSAGTTLVMPRARAPELKALVERLEADG